MQDAVHHGKDLHQEGAAADQRGEALAGPATPALAAHQAPRRWPHLADLELQGLQGRGQGQTLSSDTTQSRLGQSLHQGPSQILLEACQGDRGRLR